MKNAAAVVKELALAMAGVEESTSYGTPAFKIGGKLIARFHQSEPALVVRVELEEREHLLAADPETFYITDHYRDYPWVLVRLDTVTKVRMRERLRVACALAKRSRR